MNRRKFFKTSALSAVGTAILNPFESTASTLIQEEVFRNKKAKNIILMVSDGMSLGTLTMANLYSNRIYGKTTNWIDLYEKNIVSRGLMDMASANSIVTDSAAASSSWGCGFRVNNGSVNISTNGEELMPIGQKFKRKGKKVGVVTTVTATHATPAGFTVCMKRRNNQREIAEEYLKQEYDVIMGGGDKYFSSSGREDKKDLYALFEKKGYKICKNKKELIENASNKPLLGIFDEDALPYFIDRKHQPELQEKIPTLAEMSIAAINQMKDHPKGFVLQIESGKVDWAAHANDAGTLIYEQLQFDDAIKAVMDFAIQDKETLVIITTDHGNANPGVMYGKSANQNFDSISHWKQSNERLLNWVNPQTKYQELIDYVKHQQGIVLNEENAKSIKAYYEQIEKNEEGVYNYKKLPYHLFSTIQKQYNSVGWISMDHSGDYVEIAMFGPGQSKHKPFMKNTDLHYFMLNAAEVENNF